MSSESAGTKVFIAGAPRSGTSILLYAMKHIFELPGFGESHVMPAFNQMVHAFYQYWEPFKSVDRSVIDKTMLGRISLEDVKQSVHDYVRELYLQHFPTGSWVDKTPSPSGVTALPMAEQVFPDAKLIVTRRNGIEVVSSHMKKFDASFENACKIWISAMRELRRIQPMCKNLLIVDQYDFSNAPDKVAAEIAHHLRLPEKTEVLAKYLANERVELSSTHDWRKRLRLEDVSWPDNQKELFRKSCGELMKEFEYEF